MSAVTGISGINLSAASAAYAPTNSADVSAIASSYVESGVSGKLDASAVRTEEWMMVPMVTTISGCQISATTAAAATVADSAYGWFDASSKMDSTAVQSAYASASATQATATGVLYILLPDGA